MKTVKSIACLAIMAFCLSKASAQNARIPLNETNYSRPRLFTDIPEKAPFKIKDVESLLDLPVGAAVNASLSSGLPLVGTVVSKSNPADTSVKSVVIRTNRQGSTFTFSRLVAADGTVSFIGRMFSKNGGDALEITNEGQGYVLRKKGITELLNE
ncbi:MAG TPA: hypothetical protein VFL47_05575 [Flavisolibacter sp.]|nr:hypothetical protein [Flavisolibacter sp.]